ncbi:MAG: VOC family protein [Nocardioides sp.]|nr:VOC family protein [Nocardioides sp.]
MTTNAIQSLAIANTFVFTNDTEASLGFYRDVLGFKVHTDVSNGDFRWVTLTTPTQPDIEIVIHNYTGGGAMPMADSDAEHLHDLLAKGLLGALIFRSDDVDALFEHVSAAGAEVLQEPADQFYGVRDCAFRDPVGNMVRFNQQLPADRVPSWPSGSEG